MWIRSGSLVVIMLWASAAIASEGARELDERSSSTHGDDRFRFGVDATAGVLPSIDTSASAGAAGLDLRLGAQLSDRFAIYAEPHFSLGQISGGADSWLFGQVFATALAEATFADRFFFAGGGGFGFFFTDPGVAGPALHARAGMYLGVWSGEDHRRHGLMVGADLRTLLADGRGYLMLTACVGYDAF